VTKHNGLTAHAADTPPADDTVTVDLDDTAGAALTLAADSRTISGRVLPFGEPGRTSAGELIFPAGSISIPQDISRVKLLAGHSPTGVPVGVATAWEARDDGLYMTFQLGSSDAATEAIAQATDRVIDSFSVEAMGIIKTGRTVSKSLLKAVALVPFPAFGDARVAEVNAAHDDQDTTAPAGDPDVTVPATPGNSDAGTTTEGTDTTDDPTDADDPPADTDRDNPTTAPGESDDSHTERTDDMPQPRPAAVPTGLHPAPATTSAHASLDDVLDHIHAARAGEQSPVEAHAALTDITRSSMVDATAPNWLGELWSGVTYQRRVIPALTSKVLRGMKAKGYRWATKPGVAKYAGDKAEIPSKEASVEPVEIAAQRWAGGNDLDRAFWDFNETEILRAYWAAMAESYALETDLEAAAFLNANATAISESAPDFLRGIARAGLRVLDTTDQPATFALVNPLDVESVLEFAALDAPKYLDIVPIANPKQWITTNAVDRGTALVGTKSAVDFYELGGSPLRAEAEHIAKGGRDAALFGYTAMNLAKPDGVQKVTINTGQAA